MTRRRRAAVLLGLSLLLGALAASDVSRPRGGARARARAGGAGARRARAASPRARALDAGRARRPPRARALRARRRVPRARPRLAGLRAAVAIPAGSDLDPRCVDDGTAPAGPPGRRSRPASASPRSSRIGDRRVVAPGARVDVLVTREGAGGAPGSTMLALEDVEVLAAPARRRAATGPTPPAAGRARLRVSVRQAVYLAAAQSFARELRVLPRAPRGPPPRRPGPAGRRRRCEARAVIGFPSIAVPAAAQVLAGRGRLRRQP